MSLLAKATRRRIGKLQRHVHAFHRYAHHPLCGAYATEVIRVGKKTRLCRGCLMSCAGIGSGIGFGLMTSFGGSAIGLMLPLAMGVALTPRRLPKLLTRAIPAFLLSATLTRMFQEPSWMLGAVLLLGVATLVLYRRRGPERSPCATCPERGLDTVCSGFRPVERAERAFVRLSHRLIDQRAG